MEVVLPPSRPSDRGCVQTGTAKGRFERPALAGVTVYGKTGTATATGRGWKDGEKDVSDPTAIKRWHLWFVGYATKPGTPTLAFAAVLHGRTDGLGGDLAAPIVSKFLEWWYAR